MKHETFHKIFTMHRLTFGQTSRFRPPNFHVLRKCFAVTGTLVHRVKFIPQLDDAICRSSSRARCGRDVIIRRYGHILIARAFYHSCRTRHATRERNAKPPRNTPALRDALTTNDHEHEIRAGPPPCRLCVQAEVANRKKIAPWLDLVDTLPFSRLPNRG